MDRIWLLFFNNYNTITNKLIYDLKNPLIFESKKSKINILSVRDIYMLKNKNTEIFKDKQKANKIG